MERIRELERVLIRAETVLMVVLVLLMLGLASYNVFYRNLLVPLQKHWAHSGPPIETTVADAKAPGPDASEEAHGDGAGGFGGGFGKAAADDGDDEGGDDFGGAFGQGGDEGDDGKDTAEEDPFADVEDVDEDDGAAGGFGGAFGKPAADEGADDGADPQGDDGGEDPFADLPDIDQVATADLDQGPVGGPPPPGSFAAWGVEAIDAIKLDWIDIFLRQLVIIVSFLGAGLATQRRKHINIDALSRVVPGSARRIVAGLTNLLALGVCLILAKAGRDLVAIGREHPKDLVPWADEWMFQLMFPIGFGLLALHFVVRLIEVATDNVPADDHGSALAEPEAGARSSLDSSRDSIRRAQAEAAAGGETGATDDEPPSSSEASEPDEDRSER